MNTSDYLPNPQTLSGAEYPIVDGHRYFVSCEEVSGSTNTLISSSRTSIIDRINEVLAAGGRVMIREEQTVKNFDTGRNGRTVFKLCSPLIGQDVELFDPNAPVVATDSKAA